MAGGILPRLRQAAQQLGRAPAGISVGGVSMKKPENLRLLIEAFDGHRKVNYEQRPDFPLSVEGGADEKSGFVPKIAHTSIRKLHQCTRGITSSRR